VSDTCKHEHMVFKNGGVSSSMEHDGFYDCKDCKAIVHIHAKTPVLPHDTSYKDLKKFKKNCIKKYGKGMGGSFIHLSGEITV